jgi:O-antigen ligase
VYTAVAVAPAAGAAAFRTVSWIVHLLFGMSIAFLCDRQFRAGDLTRAYLAGFAALSIAFVIFVFGAFDRQIHWTFDLPAFVHIRHIAIYAAAAGSLAVGLMASAQPRGEWLAAFLLATTGFAISVWTGARGAALSPIAALLAGIVFFPAMRRAKAWGGALLALAVATGIAAALPLPPSDMMGLGRTVEASTTADVTTGRVAMWRLVGDAILERPALGYGEGQMPSVAPFGGMGQPHNLFLQILLAWGVAGLVCVAILGLWFLRKAVPAVRHEAELIPPFLAMASLFALSMLDAALYHILPVSIFAASAGMIIGARNRAAAGRQIPSSPGRTADRADEARVRAER